MLVAACSGTAAPTAPALVLPSLPGAIFTASGQGEQKTDWLTVPSDYALAYAYDCTGRSVGGITTVIVNVEAQRDDGQWEQLLLGGPVAASGVTYGHRGGRIYLDITINCPWRVAVGS